MATLREGPNIDIVARIVRKTALNEHLTLPVAAAVAFLSCKSSGRYLAKIADVLSRLGADSSFVSRAVARRAGHVALGLGTAGFLISLNDWLNKWCANNWTATKKGEWDWDHEIVVVTGASSGVGASVVQKLLERNPRTTLVVVDFAPLSWTPPEGSKVHYYQADLSSPGVVRDVCERIRTEVGHPTVLVNNAGIARGFTVMEGTYADVELTIKTNLLAPFLLVKEFLPDMVKHNHGHIVSVCSMSSVVAPPGLVDYSATKSGILSLHEVCFAIALLTCPADAV
jgi:all-trans-retinol dehydrogenase (NAD+)